MVPDETQRLLGQQEANSELYTADDAGRKPLGNLLDEPRTGEREEQDAVKDSGGGKE